MVNITASIALLMYFAVKCKADGAVYGISEKESFKASFDEAMINLSKNTSNTFLQLNPKQSLNQFIATGLRFISTFDESNQDDVFLFNDLTHMKNGIIREVLEFQSRDLTDRNKTVYLDNAFGFKSQAKDQAEEIELLIAYFDTVISSSKGASVIVDNSPLGHDALIQIVNKCSEYGREILGLHILRGDVTEESLLALNLLKSNTILGDISQSNFPAVLNMTEEMGLVSFNDKLRLFMTERSIIGINEICYKPNYYYYYADYQIPSTNATYIIEKVDRCRRIGDGMDQVTCFERNDGQTIKQFDLNMQKWIVVNTHGGNNTQAFLTNNDDESLRPTITAVIANPIAPWIMQIDSDKAVHDSDICGREGMKGVKTNGSKKVEICAYGFSIDIFRLLQHKLNFNSKIIASRDGLYGSYDQKNNTSSGIVREILENNADISLDMVENKPRSLALWFSKPHTITSFAIMYVKSGSFHNTGTFNPFHTTLWLAILGSIVFLIIFIWALERLSPYGRYQTNQRLVIDDERNFNIFDSANYVWGTYFTGEIIVEKSNSFGSRATITTISIVAVIIIAAYSGNLITYLLVVDETSPITGLFDERLIGQTPTVKAAVPDGAAYLGYLEKNSDARLRILYKRLTICRFEACVESLKKREFDVLLYDYHTLKYMADIDKDCSLKKVQLNIQNAICIASRKSWTWKKRIDTTISHMVESGEIDYLFKKWFGKGSCVPKNTFYAIDILKLDNLFVILGVSVPIALFILLIELIWKKVHRIWR